jgi:RNA polymerase primary sigma factor
MIGEPMMVVDGVAAPVDVAVSEQTESLRHVGLVGDSVIVLSQLGEPDPPIRALPSRAVTKAAPNVAELNDGTLADLYLDEMGEFELLTKDDEQRLGALVKKGHEAAANLSAGLFGTKANKRKLLKAVQDSEDAKEAFVEGNLRLSVSIAKRYQPSGIALSDLIQEANLGLMRAVDKFDYERGFKFSTYAVWWIKQALGRAVENQARTIRISAETLQLYKIAEKKQRERIETGEPPFTFEQLAKEVEVSEEKLLKVYFHVENASTVSLDAPVGEDGDTSFGEILEDRDAGDVHDAYEKETRDALIREILSGLGELPRKILIARFGLFGEEERKVKDIQKEFGLTALEEREIFYGALKKLRGHPQFDGFIDIPEEPEEPPKRKRGRPPKVKIEEMV